MITVLVIILTLLAAFIAIAHAMDARRYQDQRKNYLLMWGQCGAAIAMDIAARKARDNSRLALMVFILGLLSLYFRFN